MTVSTEEFTTEPIPFARTQTEDPNRDIGDNAVIQAGVDGLQTNTFTVVTVDGVETSRKLTGQTVTTPPIDEVSAIGTRQYVAPPPAAPACDPNYTGACVPIASDVDCAGGSGNGPAYVSGPVTIVGSDIYDLDRDGDRIACD